MIRNKIFKQGIGIDEKAKKQESVAGHVINLPVIWTIRD